MPEPGSPLTKSIGLPGVIRWVITVAAVIAIGAALANHQYALAIAGLVFFVVALTLAYRVWRSR